MVSNVGSIVRLSMCVALASTMTAVVPAGAFSPGQAVTGALDPTQCLLVSQDVQ